MDRQVTERDFRMPEYRDADPKDYEFDDGGKPVRKDRWERAVRRLASRLDVDRRGGWEISEVVDAVAQLADDEDRWQEIDPDDADSWPLEGSPCEVRLDDGSVLVGLTFGREGLAWTWRGKPLAFPVAAFRDDLRKSSE